MNIIESKNHSIWVGDETIRFLPEIIAKIAPTQLVFLYDTFTKEHYSPLINKLLYAVRHLKQFHRERLFEIEIPQGEQHKDLEQVTKIWEQLTDYQIDRNALMVCVGGGVVCDMGNFAASVWKRGIRSVLIPTTLLSMIDASCGGKTGIDFQGYKNIIGTFSLPEAVICDPIFLQTLPQRELLSGFAEMIKHAVIEGNLSTMNTIDSVDYESVKPLIYHSLCTKNRIILQDWHETGARKMLNFGHTIGHALERWSFDTDKPLLHGEAVALGMLAEATLAQHFQQFDESLLQDLEKIIIKHYAHCFAPFTDNDVIFNMLQDKKNQSGKVIFSLPWENRLLVLDAKKDLEALKEALGKVRLQNHRID